MTAASVDNKKRIHLISSSFSSSHGLTLSGFTAQVSTHTVSGELIFNWKLHKEQKCL